MTTASEGDITMPTITQSGTVNRPVEEVWDFISNFENTTRWSRGVLEARQTSDGPLGIGSTLQTVVKAFGRRRTADYLVTEYEPNHAPARRRGAGQQGLHLPRPEPTSDNGGS
jgi:uncharacterized protein YndB with AHSA1/START domain